MKSPATAQTTSESPAANGARRGALILNADDWGRDRRTTERTLECFLRGAISSVSAMVFMEDSERGAAVAREHGIDAGLHLNLSTRFSERGISQELRDHQERIARYLMGHRLAQVVFHPGLARSFEYVVRNQIEEFVRRYGSEPARIDGHHHLHLAANVLFQRLMPGGIRVRRNFTFQAGEKSPLNRWYRRKLDEHLAKRHFLTDCFFSIAPLEPQRVERLFSLSHHSVVEFETHPVNMLEYRFLSEGEIFRYAPEGCSVARGFAARSHDCIPSQQV